MPKLRALLPLAALLAAGALHVAPAAASSTQDAIFSAIVCGLSATNVWFSISAPFSPRSTVLHVPRVILNACSIPLITSIVA